MKNDERIAFRLPSKQREIVENLIKMGKFKNLSIFLRCAIEEFIENLQEG